MHPHLKHLTQGEDPPGVTTTQDLIVKSPSGHALMAFQNEEDLRRWHGKAKRSPNLKIVRVTRIEEEVQIKF